MPSPPKIDVMQAILQQEGMKAELNFKTPEDLDEKGLRLFKDRWSFLIKEIGPYVLAAVFVLAITTYCLVVLASGRSSEADKARVWPALLAILGGVVGVIFGKATAKL